MHHIQVELHELKFYCNNDHVKVEVDLDNGIYPEIVLHFCYSHFDHYHLNKWILILMLNKKLFGSHVCKRIFKLLDHIHGRHRKYL